MTTKQCIWFVTLLFSFLLVVPASLVAADEDGATVDDAPSALDDDADETPKKGKKPAKAKKPAKTKKAKKAKKKEPEPEEDTEEDFEDEE